MNNTFSKEGWNKIITKQSQTNFDEAKCFSNLTRQQISIKVRQEHKKESSDYMSQLDSFPILNNSNSRKINPMNPRNSLEKSNKEVSFKV